MNEKREWFELDDDDIKIKVLRVYPYWVKKVDTKISREKLSIFSEDFIFLCQEEDIRKMFWGFEEKLENLKIIIPFCSNTEDLKNILKNTLKSNTDFALCILILKTIQKVLFI